MEVSNESSVVNLPQCTDKRFEMKIVENDCEEILIQKSGSHHFSSFYDKLYKQNGYRNGRPFFVYSSNSRGNLVGITWVEEPRKSLWGFSTEQPRWEVIV